MLGLGWAGGGGCGCWDEDEGDWHEEEDEDEDDEDWEVRFLDLYLSVNRRFQYNALESEFAGRSILGHCITENVDWAGGGGEYESVTAMILQLYL
jgi:hypothetical protein